MISWAWLSSSGKRVCLLMPNALSSCMICFLFLTINLFPFVGRRFQSSGISAGLRFSLLIPKSKKQPCCLEIRALLSLARTHRTRPKSVGLMTGRKLGLSVWMSWSSEIIGGCSLNDDMKADSPISDAAFLISYSYSSIFLNGRSLLFMEFSIDLSFSWFKFSNI